jgi:uroporphyrinogen decarboxylase
VKTLDDFRRLVAERYDAGSPTRLPQYLDEYARSVRGRDYPLGCTAGGFFGQIRNWMGLENACIAFAQEPNLIDEMCDFIADFTIEVISPVLDAVDVDYCSFWEDMAYNSGPLISPRMFRDFLLPRYRRVTECIRSHGVEVITVDCDGNHNLLTPLWLEGGVNLFYPIEIRAGMDPVAMRREFGESALLMGGVDKFALAAGREAIDRVIDEVVSPLAPQLGFVPMPDHRVPPNVALDDYIYYLRRCREVTTFA